MDGCGFVRVSRLVEKMKQETSPEEVLHIVRSDDKVGRSLCYCSKLAELVVRCSLSEACVTAWDTGRQGARAPAAAARWRPAG